MLTCAVALGFRGPTLIYFTTQKNCDIMATVSDHSPLPMGLP